MQRFGRVALRRHSTADIESPFRHQSFPCSVRTGTHDRWAAPTRLPTRLGKSHNLTKPSLITCLHIPCLFLPYAANRSRIIQIITSCTSFAVRLESHLLCTSWILLSLDNRRLHALSGGHVEFSREVIYPGNFSMGTVTKATPKCHPKLRDFVFSVWNSAADHGMLTAEPKISDRTPAPPCVHPSAIDVNLTESHHHPSIDTG